MKPRKTNSVAALLISILLISCSSTKPSLKETFYSSAEIKPLKKVMIIGMAVDQDIRKQFENNFAASLKKNNLACTKSISMIPDYKNLTREKVSQLVRGKTLDAVFVVRPVKQSKETIVRTQAPVSNDNLLSYYFDKYYPVVEGQRVINMSWVQLQVSIYDATTEKLMWQGLSKQFDAKVNDIDQIANIVADMLVNELKHKNIIL